MLKSFKHNKKIGVGGDFDLHNNKVNWLSCNCYHQINNSRLINEFELKRLLKKNNMILKYKKGFYYIKNLSTDKNITITANEYHHYYIKNYHKNKYLSKLYFYKKNYIYNIIHNLKKGNKYGEK